MKIKTLKILIIILNTICIGVICALFVASFLFPPQGPIFISYAACVLVFIGFLVISVHFLERKTDENRSVFSTTHQYLITTMRYVLVIVSSVASAAGLVFFLFTNNGYYLVNSGCLIAFIMIIIIIELFVKILLPLAGIDQQV